MTKKRSTFLLKSEHQIAYAVILILLIPATIIFNTILSINSFKSNIDVELQRHALSIGRLFNDGVFEEISDPEELQAKVVQIGKSNLKLQSFEVLVPQGEDFSIVASIDPARVDRIGDDLNYVIAWHQDQPVATLVSDYVNASKTSRARYWEIAMPLHDKDGQKKAILSLRMSLEVMDNLVANTLTKSYIILSITVLIVILLLALNTRLFEHAILFRRLKEVDKMKDEFISIASHELRTPITTIKGFLSMILEGDYGHLNDDGQKSLKIMEASVNRLGHLVEDLLNVSRIEQKRLRFNLQPINTANFLESVRMEFEAKTEQKGLKLTLETEKDIAQVFADEDKLRQVLINLVGNSIKYTKKGQVELIAKKIDEKFITITIKDTGIGMSATERESLFSKFYRVQNDETRGIVGTGLGLWITKQLVEMMDGQIFVESIKHVGTQIYFTIPIYDPSHHKVGATEAKTGKKIKEAKNADK